jgi:hypothetical protein
METQEKSEAKPAVKLTKRGLPDKRAESSKKNLEKGKSIIKEALKQVKEKQALKKSIPVVYSSDEYSTDEEEITIVIPKKNISPPSKNISPPSKNISPPSKNIVSSFSFEQTLNDRLKALDEVYSKKIITIEENTKLTREELNAIKSQNQALKKSISSNFRSHAGVMNQEMYMRF